MCGRLQKTWLAERHNHDIRLLAPMFRVFSSMGSVKPKVAALTKLPVLYLFTIYLYVFIALFLLF